MSDMHAAADVTIPSEMAEARRIQDDIEEALVGAGYGDRDLFAVRLALEEAFVNAVKHGNQLNPGKHVHVRYTITAERFEIHIRDEGAGFNPDDVPDPTAPENLERPCGRGLLLIRKFMTTVDFSPVGNSVAMTKARSNLD